MKCPVCKDVTLLMSEKQGIEIDYCPKCRGIWLDRGELEKLTQNEESVIKKIEDDDYNYYKNHKEYESKPRRRKKESFLGEFFEMFGGDD